MYENAGTIGTEIVDHIQLTADVVSAYVSNNPVRPADMPDLLASVHAALAGLSKGAAAALAIEKPTPAQIRKSIRPDALISFIDGKTYKTLKRHLTSHGLTFDAYRERYSLPLDYPSTTASYSAQRSALAKSLGLGSSHRKAAPKAEEPVQPAADKSKKIRRSRKATDAVEA